MPGAPGPSNQPLRGGKLGDEVLWESKEARDLRNRVKRSTAGEVVTSLQRGIAGGHAGPKLLTAALYRLIMLCKRRPSLPAAQEACRLAMKQGLALIERGQANAWLLVSMALASYWLRFQLPVEQQQQVTATLIRLLDQASLEAQQQDNPVARQQSSETIFRDASNFVWATSGSPAWCKNMTAEDRAALRHILEQHMDAGISQAYSNLLIALLRLKAFVGDTAVAPFLEGGTVKRIVGELLARIDGMNAQACKDTIMSLGGLCFPIEPDQLVTLLQQFLLAVSGDTQPVNKIASAFAGLSRLCQVYPGSYEAVLELPEVQELCERFVQLVDLPRHKEPWATMVRACGVMHLNPAAGAEGQLLLDVLVPQLPTAEADAFPFSSIEILVGLGAFYGVPVDGKLAPALQPHRQLLASMAARAESKLELYVEKSLSTDPTSAATQVREVVHAFAKLG